MIARTDSSSFLNVQIGTHTPLVPHSLSELLSFNPAEVERCDIACLNLLCADSLPGAEGIDVASCLATLDAWTKRVGRSVQESRQHYQRDPDSYHRHRGFFCFLTMVTQLKHPQRGLGIGYQPTAIGNYDFSDSRDDLLHGLLTRKLGTCASLPVLYVAIGRRLGWPMRLAVAKRHVLCQWINADGTHRNLEGSCPGGGDTYPDEHYHQWPNELTQAELASGHFLRPMNNAESLALFLETRGHCLVDNDRFDDAREAYWQARRFAPHWASYDICIRSLEQCEARANGVVMLKMLPKCAPVPTINSLIPNSGLFPTTDGIPGLTF